MACLSVRMLQEMYKGSSDSEPEVAFKHVEYTFTTCCIMSYKMCDQRRRSIEGYGTLTLDELVK